MQPKSDEIWIGPTGNTIFIDAVSDGFVYWHYMHHCDIQFTTEEHIFTRTFKRYENKKENYPKF